MENLQEDDKTQVVPEPSQPSNVGSACEPATISPKKPIQLGIVQSSIGSRGTVSGATKRSRWDQGPGPGEVEGESSQPTVEQSQTIENSNSVKDLVKKFEGISGSSGTSNETERDEGEEKDERSEHAVSPTPTRVKLVRTNFLKAAKPEEAAVEVNTTQISPSLSKQPETTEKPENLAKEVITTHVSASLSKPNETIIKVETNTEKQKEKSEALELKSVTKSKALQIISCNYDSETDESSQDGDSSSAPDSKTHSSTVPDRKTPTDITLIGKSSDVHTSPELKEDKENEQLVIVKEAVKENQMDIDETYQDDPSIENTNSTQTSLIEHKNVDGKPSQTDHETKCDSSDQENETNKNDIDKNNKNNTKSDNIVCDINPEKLEVFDKIISEKSNIERDSLCGFGPETITSGDNCENQQIVKLTNIKEDYVTLNEETNTISVPDKSSEEFEEKLIVNFDISKAESTEPLMKSDEVDSCISSDCDAKIVGGSETTVDNKKVDDVKISDQFSLGISQSDKGIIETECLSETLNITINKGNHSENADDENQDWVIVSHDDVQEMISEDPVKSTTFDVSHDLEALNVSTSVGGKSLTSSISSEIVSTPESKEMSNSKPEEKLDTLSSEKNDELEVVGNATDVLDDNLQSINEDSQTKDSLTESSAKYSDKVDERMEEIFSENLGSSSIPEISEKESNDEETNSLKSEKTNQDVVSFEGIIETDKKQDSFEQSSGLGDLETDETLLEMLESDNSPSTTAVTDTAISIKPLSSPSNSLKDDSLPEEEQLKFSASMGVEINVGKTACVAIVTDAKVSKETDKDKSVTCMSTISRGIDKNTCHSKETVEILKKPEGNIKSKEISSAETVKPDHIVKNETQSAEDTSFKDLIISGSSTGSEVTNNKLDDTTTIRKLVEKIATKENETKLSKTEKLLVNVHVEKDLHVVDKETVPKKDTVSENERLETDETTSVASMESNPSTVAEDKKNLETNEIKCDILSDSNEFKEKTIINDTPMEIVHTSEEEHISLNDQTLETSSDLEKINFVPTPEVKHSSLTDTTVQTSNNLQKKDVDTVSCGLPIETVEGPEKFVGTSTKISVADSEIMIDDTVLPEEKSSKKDIKEQAVEDMSATKPMTTKDKSEKFAGILQEHITDKVIAVVSHKTEEHVHVGSVLCAASSKDNKLSPIPETDSFKNKSKAVQDISAISKLNYCEQKKSSIDTKVESKEINKEDFTTTKKTISLEMENQLSKCEDKTEKIKTSEKHSDQDHLKDDVNLIHEHKKAEGSETPVIVEGSLSIDYSEEAFETSSSKTNNESLDKQMGKEQSGTANEISTTLSDEMKLTSKESLPAVINDLPNSNNSKLIFSGDTQKEPANQPTVPVRLEQLDKHSPPSSHAKKDSESSDNIDEPSKMSDEVISKPSAESFEKKLESSTLDTPTNENVKATQGKVASVSSLDSSEPETIEAIDSFLKKTKSPKETVKVVQLSSIPSNSAKFPADVPCQPSEKNKTDGTLKIILPLKAIDKDLTVEACDQPIKVSLKTSSDLVKDTGSSFDTLKEGNIESDNTNEDSKKSEDFGNRLKINIAQTSGSSPEASKKTSVRMTKDIQVREKPVEPLKLKIRKTDFEVYSPKRSESPIESSKGTKTVAENKSAEKIASAGKSDLEQDKEIQKDTSVNLINKPKPIETPLKVQVTNEKSRNEKELSKSAVFVEGSTTPSDINPSAVVSDTNVLCISKLDTSKIDAIEKSISDRALTTEDTHLRPDVTENVAVDKHQTNRPAESITDSSSDSSTAKSARKKLKRTQTESKNVIEENESLKEDEKGEILPDISPVPSKTVTPSQSPESEFKQSPKATPKELPPVRVSARQKQRQAVAAALAAEEKSKDVKPHVETLTKKTISLEKTVDKKTKQPVSPTKEIGLKALFVKTTETAKQSFLPGEKSPKLVESKSPSPISPKKVAKELGQEKLEPITLKLSKEDNPVIIRSSSLSPKKVLSPQSPQQKSLGYTLKIAKDSAIIVPKDPSHSPKLKEPPSSAISSKADATNKVGYLIKDTGLTITPVSSAETQEQKLNKITLKLSKAGGHPEIKQEKAETWKAITKLGEVDIVPMEGKVSAESSKRKEKSDQGSPEKRMKLGDLTIEPSTSSGLSKLQGLLTQAPLNKAESSEDIQFVGFGSPAETSQPGEKVQYDIGLVKPEDELSMPKKRGRPRKITSPSEMVHSVTHSGLAGSKSILAASLQHQTVQQHIHQQKNLQVQQSTPQEDADSSIPMFPVPLFDLSDDTFMEPHPTIFPEQVQPETIIMRSARGRPIGRSRRPRGSGLARGERGGPRGRPRGSRGIKKILEEMEFLSYPDMEQPITLDNIDAEIPRILEPPVSHITEKTMALLRKSIECKKESLEKKRRSDGSDSDNKDSDLDAKVKEMKEKIEAAYKAELESPGKDDKEATKRTPEKVEIKEVAKRSPEQIPCSSSDAAVKRKSIEENAPFHGIGKDILKRKLSEEKLPEKRMKRKSTEEMSGGKGKEKNESKKLKVLSVQDDQKHVKRKSIEEKSESVLKIESMPDENKEPKETTDNLSEKPDVEAAGQEDQANKVSEEMEVDEPTLTDQPAESEKLAEAEEKVAEPAKPVKPRPKSKAEIKRIKREKDRLRREAKKLAALEALKAPPPNPSEDDTRMSASDVNGDGIDDGFGFKKNRMEVGDAEGKEFCVEYIAEYQWPLQGGELYMIQEQISTYLAVKSFKRKYPDIKRRPVEMEERTYLCDSGLVSESMCDLGLTAVSSSEVLDIMFQDFPDQYEELRKNMRDKAARELINKQKEKKKFEQSLSKSDLKEHAIQSAQSWNQALNRNRNESRRCHLDLQTWTVQYPRSRGAKMTRPTPKLGNYPLALIPGQYSDYCKRYTPQELRYWPINTVLYGPLQPNERNSTGGSEGSQSESEDSSSSDDTSESSSDGEGTEEEEKDCKVCGGGRKGGEATVRCSQCAHHIHTSCADLKPSMLVHLRKYPWQCSVCKTCQRCNDSKNESKMLFCDECDRGYHSYCVGLRRVPAGSWTCQICTDA